MSLRWMVLPICAVLFWAPLAQGMGPRGMLQQVMLKVGMSETQRAEAKKLHYAAERKVIEIRYQQEQAQLELEQALDAPKPDRARIFALIERVEDLEVQVHKNRLGLLLDIRALMTPEQWRKLENLQKERRARRQERAEEIE